MARIGIIGSAGRMGQALVETIAAAGEQLAGGVDKGDDLAALAATSDVLLDFSSPAALEGKLDEAMAAGVPIVAPHHGTFPELLDGVAGLLHVPNDPADLARTLRAVLDDPVRAAALGAAGHARVRAYHTFTTMAAGHERMYERLLP